MPPKPDTYKMIFIVRKDLKMKTGKIAAQCCHATLGLYKNVLKNKEYSKYMEMWEATGQKKIVVKCKDLKEMTRVQERAKLMKIPEHMICDAGLTQVAAGSFTVLALFGSERKLKSFTGQLKLV